MKYLNLSFNTPEENITYDESLLDACETGESRDEILRFWEPKQYFVVLGYSNRAESEVNEAIAKKLDIPVLRRSSGGGTVLQGPGCLNYSLILRIDRAKELSNLVKTNFYVLNRHKEALQQLVNDKIEIQGISDLTINNLKFSGNAQRRKKGFLLYHGTFLLNMDLALIQTLLKIPSKQPEYRNHRSHTKFVTNLSVSKDKIKAKLERVWLS